MEEDVLHKEVAEHIEQPKDIVERGKEGAKILKRIIESRKDKVVIGGKQYLQFQDWQMIGRFYKSTAGVKWTHPIMKDGEIFGWEAKANVLNADGKTISSAESSCSRDEENWKTRPDFQLRSMSQTRACAKALRNVFSWVVVLAGFESTPAEEMIDDAKDVKVEQVKPNGLLKCGYCGIKVNESVWRYSMDHFGRALCYSHQKQLQEVGELESVGVR